MSTSKDTLRGRLLGSLALGVIGALAAPNASAQEQSASAQAESQSEAIIVTGVTKRAERLATIPVAVTNLSGELIERQRVQTIQDVLIRVPSTSFNELRGPGGSFPIIRGSISSDDSGGVEESTALFQDGLFYGSAMSFSPDFFDVSSVNVLRGPQGTAFGRNVVGGAVIVESNEPSFTPSAQLSVTGGDYSRFDTNGYVTGALSDSVAGRLAVSYKSHDGYQTNLVTHHDIENQDMLSARGSLLFNINPDVTFKVIASATQDRNHGVAQHLIYDIPLILPAGTPNPPLDPDYVSQDTDGRLSRDMAALTTQLDWKTSLGTVTNVLGYHRLSADVFTDSDGTAANIWNGDPQIRQNEDFWSEELRIASPAGPDRQLDYLAGVYYMDSDIFRDKAFGITGTAGTFVPQHFLAHTIQDTTTKAWAAFAEVVYRPIEQFDVRLGGRYTSEDKSGTVQHTQVNGTPAPTPNASCPTPALYNSFSGCAFAATPFSGTFERFTPRVTAEFKPNQDTVFYATYAEGYKSGGFNSDIPNPANVNVPFRPERNVTLEGGVKTTLFDGRLFFNVDYFDSITRDLQVRQGSGLNIIAVNAGREHANGWEFQIDAHPTSALDLGISGSSVEATFSSFVFGTSNFTGKQVPYVPQTQYTPYIQYAFDMGNMGTLTLRSEYLYRSRVFFDNANTPNFTDLSERKDLNLRATWESEDGAWTASLWGNNVTDERAIVALTPITGGYFYVSSLANAAHVTQARYQDPRTFGITLTRRWN
ncbi:MAG TPA: TonB-dependent receptor [Caulobacterales bacterium]|nr:TonB-dependent receptor [Caulobacterales bacterium]